MSVVNQMLKDLAKRSKSASPISEEVFANVIKNIGDHKPKNNRSTKIFAVTSLLSIFLLVSIIVLPSYFMRQQPPQILPPSLELPPLVANAISLSDNSTSLALLTGITLQVQNSMTHMSLMLNNEALYRINKPHPDELQIILENTKLEASIPKINTLNSAIIAMNMQNRADGTLIINLKLKNGAELAHVNLNSQHKSSELQIELKYKDVVIPSVQTTEEASIEQQPMKSIKKVSQDFSSQEEFQQAVNYAAEGQIEAAFNLLNKVLNRDPAFVPARKLLATLWIQNGNNEKAEDILEAGLTQTPTNPMFLQLKAQILMSLGKISEALELLKQSPPTLAENPEYHALMAVLLQQMGKSSHAAALYTQLLTLQPQNAIWWLGLAIAKESLDKKIEAYEAYARANTENISPELKAYIDTRMTSLQG